MFKKVYCATTIGIETQLVFVEVDISLGMLQWHIVGLPDTAIKESKQRISSAIKNSGIKLPERKITINLAPAEIKKEGTSFDLAMAVAILLGSSIIQLSNEFIEETIFLGELALNGSLYPINGALPIASDAIHLLKKRIILPKENVKEVLCIKGIDIIGISSLLDFIEIASGHIPLSTFSYCYLKNSQINIEDQKESIDFEDVKGQEKAKRAMQIASAGNHNVIMIGSPGSGKSMLAERLKTIMPPLSEKESIDVSKIYSIAGKTKGIGLLQKRPFRAPHHTISSAGLLGGGSSPQPGEISFAHNGILFLDELLEFKRSCLEDLRQPLENKKISISRAQASIEFPSSFLLIAAMNPCPCGFYGDPKKKCSCTQKSIFNYLSKLSGPLLDRIDLQVALHGVSFKELESDKKSHSSSELYIGVLKAINQKNLRNQSIPNGLLTIKELEKCSLIDKESSDFLEHIFNALHLSARSYHKLLRVARTIADLNESKIITLKHFKEAYSYRQLDIFLEKQIH